MNEQNRVEKKYETWDEAFRGLVPAIRQQSVRVAAYTQVLFVQACASSLGKHNSEWTKRMQGQYTDLAYKCGLYHQLGKSLLVPEQQLWCKDFSDEEKAIYQTYPEAGRRLVAGLQDKKIKDGKERPTNNLPWLMLRETCEQHMERWDGTGYPSGRVGEEISPIAQIVGLAKELDRLVSETKSENPFEEAYAQLMKQADKEFSAELIEVLKAARGKCRGIYKKYIQYTRTIPKTIPLVDRRKERPLGLTYKVLEKADLSQAAMYEGVPWFGGVLGDTKSREHMEQLEPMMIRTKILKDVMFYLMYEAADTILHMQNCQLQTEGILLPMPAGFYRGESQKGRLEQLFMDQPIDSSKLLLTVPAEALLKATKEVEAQFMEYIEAGIQLVLDDYHPEKIPLEKIRDIGFSKVRLALDMEPELEAETITILKDQGMMLVKRSQSGKEVVEEELIQELLLSER